VPKIHTFSKVSWLKVLNPPILIKVNLPHVEFATQKCKRQFYEWKVVDFSEPSQECSLICQSGTTSLSDSTQTLGK
jgi:hypothetical protein